MRGTSNTIANYVAGNSLVPAAVNDHVKLITTADDDLLFDLLALEPPAAATPTNVRVVFLPLNPGASVRGDGAARNVKIQPMRVLRSSVSNSYPREILSAVLAMEYVLALPSVPSAGNWGMLLLYAELSYVDTSNPTKGTQVSFNWAVPSYVAFASAPNWGTLPANTSTVWRIPIKYVKNVAAATTVSQEDIFDIEPDATYLGNVRNRVSAKFSGVQIKRAYSTNQNPKNLIAGGSSAFNANPLSSTVTPAVVWRDDIDLVVMEILVPEEVTGGTSAAPVDVTLDTSRDWRKANFSATWCIRTLGAGAGHLGEESSNVGSAASRSHPSDEHAIYVTIGQTHETYAGAGTFYMVGMVTIGTTVSLSGAANPNWATTGDYFMLMVDTSTGALKLRRNITGTSDGGPIWIKLEAFFGNGR